jgi:hypothetical protein
MNDDALSPDLELASAYLDGDVDEAQRAQVEASPALLAQVATFRQLSAALADTPPATATSRDAAVAAALAEFDVLLAAPAAAAGLPLAPNVVPMRRHARWSRVMLAAAAVALIGVVGVTAIKSLGSGSDDQSSSAIEPAAKDAGGVEAAADTAGGGAPQTIGAINGAAAVIPEIEEPAQLNTLSADNLFTTSPDTSAATTAAAAGADSSIAAETTSPAAATETTAAGNVAAAPSGGPATRSVLSFSFDCPLAPNQVIIAEITWKGTPAVAVRDTVSGVTQAVDANCNVLASSDQP